MSKDTYTPANGTNADEDRKQGFIATDVQWRISKIKSDQTDSRSLLESVGVIITGTEELFYLVDVPEGWYRECFGYTTTLRNAEGKGILEQFCKLTPWDTRVTVLDYNR